MSSSQTDPNSESILRSHQCERLVKRNRQATEGVNPTWTQNVATNITTEFTAAKEKVEAAAGLLSIGEAALEAFLQANVTGPPLAWSPQQLLLRPFIAEDSEADIRKLQSSLILDLSVDGESVYRLLPNVELFALAKVITSHADFPNEPEYRLLRMRVNTWHQRLLNEISPTLQDSVYSDLDELQIDDHSELLIERATIHLLHGLENKARVDLEHATKARNFEYRLTGRLGKRTKYQQKELSQLVVLARSQAGARARDGGTGAKTLSGTKGPKAVDLQDDILLSRISFTDKTTQDQIQDNVEDLPQSLVELDPADQPKLQPFDSVILLLHASILINFAAQDELSREEVTPYATRVIDDGSSNWQIYTQALLVRSRIEYHKSRTVERGVLQLQALVDQVIAETSGGDQMKDGETPSTFLPKSSPSESAPASERLEYIHQLASPTRWKLEAELAGQWVSLGGLKTALEIYERLEMWAEAALCWAANNREDQARKIIHRELYNPVITTSTEKLLEDEDDTNAEYRIERDPLPADAPRLFCILGDIDKSPTVYERAWEVSKHRFARAKRSLGRYYAAEGDFSAAASAYVESLKVNPQNQAIWFALGCVYLQLEDWSPAADAFGRAVQIDDSDAESWSNLAVSLLKISDAIQHSDDDDSNTAKQRRIRESFVALKRAANLKRGSFRIWQNLLSVAIKLVPPPYFDIVIAQDRLIDILGSSEGEKCIDIPIMEALLADTIRLSLDQDHTDRSPDETQQHGLEKMVTDLFLRKVQPLITSSRRLWLLIAKLDLHLKRPSATLTAYEKAWRTQLNRPNWDSATSKSAKAAWHDVADATIDLIDAYETFGEKAKESGLGEGELVAKDWKFKARSAGRSVLARAKEIWEDDEWYLRVRTRVDELV